VQQVNKAHWLFILCLAVIAESIPAFCRQPAVTSASHYANLDWAIEERRMDLPKLRVETEAALQQARVAADARRTLDHFVDSFGDGHLELNWPKGDSQAPTAADHASLCERLGYKGRRKAWIDFSLLPQFSPLPTEDGVFFSGGLLKLPSGKTLGIVRIGVFSEKAYPEACQQAVQELNMPDNANCGDECAKKIEIRTANLLTAALTASAEELRRAGAAALLVDITHNGGGSDWVEAAPRALSSKPLRDPRLAFIKNEHWTTQLEDALKEVDTDLNNHRGPNQLLRNAAATLERAIAASKRPCNPEEAWTTGKVDCSLLVKDLLFASGVLSYAPPGSFTGLESRTTLFHPARYAYTEKRNRLPLYLLVDSDTWSAAEYFAALLQDNKAATIVGELTGGAGCGYNNGGIPTELKNSKAEIKMPHCVRLRADGSDEVNGVTPDVPVPWAHRDSPFQRAQKLFNVLRSLR